MNQRQHYQHIISTFASRNVLVIGDAILDVYLKGKSTRLTPEAPVPVVDIIEKKIFLGGAANTVCNLRALGAHVSFCSVLGDDDDGKNIRMLLHNIGVDSSGVIVESGRESQVKTRIMSGGHFITRFDTGSRALIHTESEDAIIHFIHQRFTEFDAIVISDYDKGLITTRVLEVLTTLAAHNKIPIAIDSKRLPFFNRIRAAFVKPNYDEVLSITGLLFKEANRWMQIEEHREQLTKKINAEIIAVTLDEEGSVFIDHNNECHHFAAELIEDAHVSGAGDTFLSAAILTWIEEGQINVVQEIATAAASISVRKENTSTCTPEELLNYFPMESKSIESLYELQSRCEHYRRLGKTIVFTNGCFDILHSGHVTYLHCAKELGDILIVGINNDESIKRIKGPDRPINSLEDRMKVLSGLYAVDHVVPFGSAHDDTPVELIKTIKPDYFVKGGDYSKDKLPEAETVEENGGEIVFLPFIPDHSTTSIINKISSNVKVYDQG